MARDIHVLKRRTSPGDVGRSGQLLGWNPGNVIL